MSRSWDAAVFDRLYAASDDPWNFQGSDYEKAKYAATLAALGGRRFAQGLEIGCSIGVLTRMLAQHCEKLLAVDGSAAALALAQAQCADLPQVTFGRAQVPGEWPSGSFDLMVFSEILYFLDAGDLRLVARQAAANLQPSGVVVLVNWIGRTDTPHSGDAAADGFIAACGLRVMAASRAASYRLDVLGRAGSAG